MKGVNEISLLSYNLNCLPFGAIFRRFLPVSLDFRLELLWKN